MTGLPVRRMLHTMKELSVRPTPSSRDARRRGRMRPARTRRALRAERFAAPVEALSLPVLGAHWQSALEAAQAALAAAARTLPPEELRGRRPVSTPNAWPPSGYSRGLRATITCRPTSAT